MWKSKGPRIAKIILKKLEDSHFESYYKATVFRTVWYRHSIDIQTNRIEMRIQSIFFLKNCQDNSIGER